MTQSGQVRQKITEQQLIGLLDQVEGQGQPGAPGGGSGGAGKITVRMHRRRAEPRLLKLTPPSSQFTRKKTMDDSDDDFDL